MLPSSLPPIKGLLASQSLSHHRTENKSSRLLSNNEIDDYGGDVNDNITFSSDDLLCAFFGMFIHLPFPPLQLYTA